MPASQTLPRHANTSTLENHANTVTRCHFKKSVHLCFSYTGTQKTIEVSIKQTSPWDAYILEKFQQTTGTLQFTCLLVCLLACNTREPCDNCPSTAAMNSDSGMKYQFESKHEQESLMLQQQQQRQLQRTL
jgi:hypothetical protein